LYRLPNLNENIRPRVKYQSDSKEANSKYLTSSDLTIGDVPAYKNKLHTFAHPNFTLKEIRESSSNIQKKLEEAHENAQTTDVDGKAKQESFIK